MREWSSPSPPPSDPELDIEPELEYELEAVVEQIVVDRYRWGVQFGPSLPVVAGPDVPGEFSGGVGDFPEALVGFLERLPVD